MRFPNQRLAQLFDLLQNETLPQDELAQRLSVSTRTVRADITALNALLASHGAQFILSRGNGYLLKIEDAERYQQLQASHPRALRIPRTGPERVHYLVVRFLTSAFSLKLEDLADEWFASRATLQSDMAEVREWFHRYNLTLETRPRHGMKLFGSEMSTRACLTDLLWELAQQDSLNPLVTDVALNAGVAEQMVPVLHDALTRHHIRLTDEGELFLRLYCAVSVRRISEGYPLPEFHAEDVEENVREAAKDIAVTIQQLAGKALSPSEESWLCVHIAARQIQEIAPSAINADDDEALVNYILRYINTHYNYNLLSDAQLHADLLTHIKTMITRVRYQIMIPNPLLDNIKQHYPMAWDMTLAAVSSWGKYTPYVISENEIGFLVLHIGVGLERHYNIGYQRQPRVLLVCDAGNAMVRMIEAVLQRKYPQIEVTRTLTLREYELAETISEDFVIATARVSEKSKPVVMIAPFPTDYQLEQIGKLVLVDRTRPWCWINTSTRPISALSTSLSISRRSSASCVNSLRPKALSARSFWIRLLSVKLLSAPCSATASRCRTPSACWRRKRWSTPCSPRTACSGATKPRTLSSCSPSAKASTKRRWRFTIFSSLSCASGRCHGSVAARISPGLRRWRWRV